MPFGLRNAPTTFQRMVEVVLKGLEEFSIVYINDILIAFKCWIDHLSHIRLVLDRLGNANLKAKPKKCEFGRQKLVYLGHKLGGGTMSVPEERVEAFKKYPGLRPGRTLKDSWKCYHT